MGKKTERVPLPCVPLQTKVKVMLESVAVVKVVVTVLLVVRMLQSVVAVSVTFVFNVTVETVKGQ